MTIDTFASSDDTLTSPATNIEEITPSDVNDLAQLTIGLNVATPGVVRVTTAAGTISDVFIAPGVIFPLRVRRVWSTGTNATGVRGLF
jgi:hypothetical protein